MFDMKTVDELTTRFRAEGLRVTPQRQVIFRLLHGVDTHPTVESLYEAARSEMPTISRKTVYQTVHDLESMDEVELLDVGTGASGSTPTSSMRTSTSCARAAAPYATCCSTSPTCACPRGTGGRSRSRRSRSCSAASATSALPRSRSTPESSSRRYFQSIATNAHQGENPCPT